MKDQGFVQQPTTSQGFSPNYFPLVWRVYAFANYIGGPENEALAVRPDGQEAMALQMGHEPSCLLGRGLLQRPALVLGFRCGGSADICVALIPLLALEREGGAPHEPLAGVADLLIHKPDVQRALVRVQPCVLHWEHPRLLVRLVVVAVPPPRRRHKHTPGDPVHPHRVHEVPLRVKARGHQGVGIGACADSQVQGHRVVSVRLLDAVGCQGVEQAPQHVRESLCLGAGGVAEQHSTPVKLRGTRSVADLLHSVEEHPFRPHSGLKLALRGLNPEVA
mmetsp:Transcript_7472/g.21105  ORF Transcript_7472/g.21105 Transcript_7472/m.21105 type:complete len:277 (+) Transcript_7472:93-923(+)|eukprot:CAMPEP_0117677420 /NCGR_PEP_ID=MMETSP0804-20121206/16735_1 /TAXON_ID=1074897 /ORGANISM="Tetraselmis astigmatica, Strain CCMP880" /LENGTH=276 /DNA_ID=CAMNT_0005486701 /DNA_START=44 /DNA_END=874 /DNA_ORIENTATION=+